MSDVQDHADTGAEASSGAEGAGEAQSFTLEAYAEQFGWKPKDQWKGDDSKWTDAPEFLKHTFDRTKEVAQETKKRIEHNNRVNARLMEAERKKAREAIADAERRIEEAAAEGDTEGAKAATRDLRVAEQQREALSVRAKFEKENPWFGSDKRATRLAQIAAQELIDEVGNPSPEEQFEAARKAVQEAMPHLFEGSAADDDDDEPAPKPKKAAPMVQGGARTPPLRRGPKGWDDIPLSDRKAVEKAYINSGRLTKEEYAKTYWTEKGEAA